MLVECNPHDRVFGVGLSINSPDALIPEKWKGTNLLGRILVSVREELKHLEKND